MTGWDDDGFCHPSFYPWKPKKGSRGKRGRVGGLVTRKEDVGRGHG